MSRDRAKISEIIIEMLDNPDENGIFDTSTAFTKLECYIESVRIEVIDWFKTHICLTG